MRVVARLRPGEGGTGATTPRGSFDVVAKDFGDFANKLAMRMVASALCRGGLKECIVAWVKPSQAT